MKSLSDLLSLSKGVFVPRARVSIILPTEGQAMAKFRKAAKLDGRLIDATRGKAAKSLILSDTNHVLLCSLTPQTVAKRFDSGEMDDEG
jgi:regulator of extracellular matrix RemA (YlzA/DUF370 family)